MRSIVSKMKNIDFELIIPGINIKPEQGSFGYSSCCLLHDEKANILCDTGSFGVRTEIKSILHKIDFLFLSHLHFDHCANIDLFLNIPIYVSKKEIESLYLSSDNNVYEPLKFFINQFDIRYLEDVESISPNTSMYPTPGHTKGHYSIGFNSKNKKCIFAGDAIKTLTEYMSTQTSVAPINKVEYTSSKRFIINNFDVIIPGHQNILYKEHLTEKKVKLTSF